MNRVASAVAVVAVILSCAWGCSSSTRPQQNDGAAGATACNCHVDERNGVLTMSWSCYCASTGGCTRTFAQWCDDVRERIDHPACGFTVLHMMGLGGPFDDVYDQERNLVGAAAAGDSADAYKCPDDPTLAAPLIQAGQFPPASCEGISCGKCSSSSCADAGR